MIKSMIKWINNAWLCNATVPVTFSVTHKDDDDNDDADNNYYDDTLLPSAWVWPRWCLPSCSSYAAPREDFQEAVFGSS